MRGGAISISRISSSSTRSALVTRSRRRMSSSHELDEVGLLVTAELAGVLENSPCERAVAPTLVPELVEGAQERGAVFGVDPVFDLHQDRPAIVIDFLMGLGLAPMLRGRKVKRRALLQRPSPGERDAGDRAPGRKQESGREPGVCGDVPPRGAAQGHRPEDDAQE